MNIPSNSLLALLIILAGLYICFGASLLIKQSRFIYYPDRTLFSTPKEIGLKYESITFSASDGVQLSAWLVPAEPSMGIVLFCHGNAGNISHRLETIEIINRLGYSIFIFDYRGYGMSEGTPSEEGTYRDVEAAWNYLLKHQKVEPSEIILFGRSLGGAIASWLAARTTPKACILESCFSSVCDMAASLYPFLPTRLLCRFSYNTLENSGKISAPLLVIHSPDDDVVPFSHGREIFNHANEPKTFLQISGNHNNGFLVTGKRYENGLNNFLDNLGS
ncbi:MAG: alpha/beta hydrolase [Desulfobulbaceae bacterium]|nr:alpha/beta hydrolase [Desulfobulbaceae bacterium]